MAEAKVNGASRFYVDPELHELSAKLLEALKSVETFVAEELACRESSMLPDPNEGEEVYLSAARNTLELVRAVIATAEVKRG